MSGCQIQAILNELGPNANSNKDLAGWCDSKYSNDKNFSLPNGAHCEVTSRNFSPKYPLGTLFTCANNSISVTLGKDAPSIDAPAYVTVTQQKTTTPVTSFKSTPGENCTPIKPISGATSYIYDENGNCIAAPTTPAPTTIAPTTPAPTTIAPTTMASATIAPTTIGPTPSSNKMIYIIAAIVIMLLVFGLIMFMKKPKIVSAFGKKLFKCRRR